MLEDYAKARKLGLKQVERDVSDGRYPYPPALDDILKNQGYQGEVPIGLTEIDLSLIAGTKTRGRQNMFSSSFMPIAEAGSEFAAKWSDLIDSQRAEGLRDPIVVYEYLQRFYVQEGNKRVSVSRYVGSPTILANITRVVPMPSDEKGLRIYHEFTRFYHVCPIYGIISGEEGFYARLAALVGQDLEHPWPEDVVRDLRSTFDAFSAAFRAHGGDALDLQVGDALATYVSIFGFNHVRDLAPSAVAEEVDRIWGEFVVTQGEGARAYLEDPSLGHTAPLPKLKSLAKTAVPVLAKPFRVAFIYDRNPLSSGWIALHERGRKKLEERLGSSVVTHAFTDRSSDAAFDQAVDEAVADGVDLVITCSATQMRQALRAAAKHPGPAYLNCSVSLSHSAVRGFYGRMYEAKFLLGALAASLAPHHQVGYVANSPVFSTVAEINAFAIGAQMVDPYATVHLKWFSAKDYDWRRELREEGVTIVSGRDYANPLAPRESWGLYRVEESGAETHLAEPVWKWGRYYELLVRSIRNDTWRKEGEKIQGQSLNYWWGMSAGVLDVALTGELPRGQRKLVEVLRQSVLSGRTHPFTGELVAQGGDQVQGPDAGRLTSEQIVRMRWLNENVVGRLPEQRELSRDGLVEVEVAGVIPVDPARLLLKDTSR
ncbi:BMP family ABC transporter substrate-binding protein [Olsenella profusa]|uniref:BMP family ABC transporter substrate-binding protein n=1 Tax=Olsenella profusa TaxID=138595 RepID=A0ABS2F4T0_9ACTN|nr:BMP family ABC transporter substrate-binding protein [Olsenella profusa]MBM6775572.1 BMP family ABC transporter substrate-binding protein [Olsenella profusa]